MTHTTSLSALELGDSLQDFAMHCNSRTKHIRCCCRSVAMAAPERQGLDNGGYVRHPTVCNGRVAFVVEEDIWLTDCCAKGTNGPKIPKRMTNFGRAAHPLFSPSADYIAFTDSSDLWVLTVKDGRCRFAAQCSLTHGIAQCHMSPKLQAAYMVCHGCFRLQWVRCRCLQCSPRKWLRQLVAGCMENGEGDCLHKHLHLGKPGPVEAASGLTRLALTAKVRMLSIGQFSIRSPWTALVLALGNRNAHAFEFCLRTQAERDSPHDCARYTSKPSQTRVPA